jgi:hypothetical protein
MNYIRVYKAIIRKAKRENRKKTEDLYLEKHHIKPISLYPQFEKSKWNIVLLTPREHFICHWLLYKHFSKTDEKMKANKMAHAWFRMSSHPSKSKMRYYNSHTYELSKKAHCKACSNLFKGKMLSKKELIRRKFNNPRAKRVFTDNICFLSVRDAALYYNTSKSNIRKFMKNEITLEDILNPKPKPISEESRRRRGDFRRNKTWEEIYGKEGAEQKRCRLIEKRKGKTLEQLYGEERSKGIKINISNSRIGKPGSRLGAKNSPESRAKLSKARTGVSISSKKYILIKPDGEEIFIEKGGIRKYFRDNYNCNFPLKTPLKTGKALTRGKWKNWKVYYA